MTKFRRKIGIVLVTGAAAAILAVPASAGTSKGGGSPSLTEISAAAPIRYIELLDITKYRGGPALVSPKSPIQSM